MEHGDIFFMASLHENLGQTCEVEAYTSWQSSQTEYDLYSSRVAWALYIRRWAFRRCKHNALVFLNFVGQLPSDSPDFFNFRRLGNWSIISVNGIQSEWMSRHMTANCLSTTTSFATNSWKVGVVGVLTAPIKKGETKFLYQIYLKNLKHIT